MLLGVNVRGPREPAAPGAGVGAPGRAGKRRREGKWRLLLDAQAQRDAPASPARTAQRGWVSALCSLWPSPLIKAVGQVSQQRVSFSRGSGSACPGPRRPQAGAEGCLLGQDSFLESPTPSLVAMAMINQTRTQTLASLPASHGLGQASGALGHGDLPLHFAVQPVSLPCPWCPQAEPG